MLTGTLLSVCCSSLLVLSFTSSAEASGAGRAFPIESENYIIERFQQLNPRIKWDPTNFLVDLAGHYANCQYREKSSLVPVDRPSPDGDSVTGVVDNTVGWENTNNAVDGYIRTIVDRWMKGRTHNHLIYRANRFGCSVRPGCSNKVVVSCLFSPSSAPPEPPPPPPPGPTRYEPDKPNDNLFPKALAFTPEQYVLTEVHTGTNWDRSHFLENLSGVETSCDMLRVDAEWGFEKSSDAAEKYGMRVTGLYGSYRNRGRTEDALDHILRTFKKITHAREVGCSIIPDCIDNRGEMYVVASCLYSEE